MPLFGIVEWVEHGNSIKKESIFICLKKCMLMKFKDEPTNKSATLDGCDVIQYALPLR